MRKIKLYDTECSYYLGEAWIASSIIDPLPKYVLWKTKVFIHYFEDRYHEIAIEPASDADDRLGFEDRSLNRSSR